MLAGTKTVLAAKQYDVKQVIIAGGVAANKGLRTAMQEAMDNLNIKLTVPQFKYCTDNAAMVGAQAIYEYKSGNDDYAGKYIPLAPRETMSANVAYSIPVPRSFANYLILNIGWNGVGRIYWNEENSLSQAFYAIWNASLSWEKGHYGVSLWGKNLLNEDFKTFYFKSIGNNFFAKGKPLQFGVSLHLNL